MRRHYDNSYTHEEMQNCIRDGEIVVNEASVSFATEPGESSWSFAVRPKKVQLDAMDAALRPYGWVTRRDLERRMEIEPNIYQHSDLAQFMVDLYYFIKCDERGRACRELVRLAHELVVGALRSCARCRSSFVNNGMTPCMILAGKGKSKKNQKVNGCVGEAISIHAGKRTTSKDARGDDERTMREKIGHLFDWISDVRTCVKRHVPRDKRTAAANALLDSAARACALLEHHVERPRQLVDESSEDTTTSFRVSGSTVSPIPKSIKQAYAIVDKVSKPTWGLTSEYLDVVPGQKRKRASSSDDDDERAPSESYGELTIKSFDAVVDALVNNGRAAGSFVDIGCGYGKCCFHWSLRNPSSCRVLGVDCVATRVEMAKRAASDIPGSSDVVFTHANAAQTTEPLDFDNVYCMDAVFTEEDSRAIGARLNASSWTVFVSFKSARAWSRLGLKRARMIDQFTIRMKDSGQRFSAYVFKRMADDEDSESDMSECTPYVAPAWARLPAARTLPHVAGFGSITVTGSEFERLKGNRWLNDTIMNAKLAMMAMKQQSCGKRRVHLMNTYFWPRLDALGYDAVASWTDKMVPDDAILCDRILVPINIENEHWTLVDIDMKKRTCIYIDSMGHEVSEITETQRYILRVISRWVELEFRNRVDENARDVIKKICAWRTKSIQQNGYDCGLFVLKIAEHLTRHDWPSARRVAQDEINTFRGDLFRELEAASLCDDDP